MSLANKCPTCGVAPEWPCLQYDRGRRRPRKRMHNARENEEMHAWARTYDLKYRELPEGQRFCVRPYARKKAA